MMRICPMCGRPEDVGLIGVACGRCEKIASDVEAEMVIVSSRAGHQS